MKENKEKNSKPCNTPSDQVHALLEFQQAQPHLHNRMKISQNSLLLYVRLFVFISQSNTTMYGHLPIKTLTHVTNTATGMPVSSI